MTIATFGPALQPAAITPAFIGESLKAVFTFWQHHGVDRDAGGFFGGVEIAAPHDPSPVDLKALFANGRQIYAFCLVAPEFPDMQVSFLEAAGSGMRFMREHFWQDADGNKGRLGECAARGGWVVATDRRGDWVQPTMPSYLSNSALKIPGNRELYEDAFVLLSFSQFYLQTKDESILPWLDATMERLTDSAYFGRAAGGLGFNEHASLGWELLEGAPRTQNSHMHLLEAFLSCSRATGEARYLEEAAGIVELFFAKLFDAENGCVGEFFGHDWQPDPEQGENVEAGHSFEWVWLLHEYYKAASAAVDGASDGAGDVSRIPAAMEVLYARGCSSLDAEHGGVYDQISRSGGAVLKSTKRLWPQVERTKADAAMAEYALRRGAASGRDERAEAQLRDGLLLLFQSYAAPDGLWSDNHARENVMLPTETRINGPNVYHIVVALLEAKRVLELIQRAHSVF